MNKSSDFAAAPALQDERSIKSFSSALFNISAVVADDAKMDVSIKAEEVALSAFPLYDDNKLLFTAESGRKFFWPLTIAAKFELFVM